jgi:hypothetical protein
MFYVTGSKAKVRYKERPGANLLSSLYSEMREEDKLYDFSRV